MISWEAYINNLGKGFLFLFFYFFESEFQLMASAFDDSFLSSDQDTNQFLV